MDNSESFESLLASQETPGARLEQGQKVEGIIIAISGDDVFIDVGLKQDGVMERAELPESVQAGDKIEAYVIAVTPQGARLSRSMSGAGIAAIEDAKENAIPVTGRVTGTCKGGYNVDVLGRRAFCPGSQIGFSKENEEDIVNAQLQFLVTRVEEKGRNIVVSRRALLDRERKENLEKLLSSIKDGDIIEGTVSRHTPYGVFVELAPGIEGMAHNSEISWSRDIEKIILPEIGEKIKAKVLSIDKDDKGRHRFSLSIKQLEENPWDTVEERFRPGQIVSGKVTRFVPFGAIVEIFPGIEGLLHVSEMAWGKKVRKPEDILSPGDVVEVAIRELDKEGKKISLSLREAQGNPWTDAEEKYKPGAQIEGVVESRTPHGIFVQLEAGITGLLPAGVIRNSPLAPELNKLGTGDRIKLAVQNLDLAARRISLKPVEKDNGGEAPEDKSWKEHVKLSSDNSMGTMALAFQKALSKKGKK